MKHRWGFSVLITNCAGFYQFYCLPFFSSCCNWPRAPLRLRIAAMVCLVGLRWIRKCWTRTCCHSRTRRPWRMMWVRRLVPVNRMKWTQKQRPSVVTETVGGGKGNFIAHWMDHHWLAQLSVQLQISKCGRTRCALCRFAAGSDRPDIIDFIPAELSRLYRRLLDLLLEWIEEETLIDGEEEGGMPKGSDQE